MKDHDERVRDSWFWTWRCIYLAFACALLTGWVGFGPVALSLTQDDTWRWIWVGVFSGFGLLMQTSVLGYLLYCAAQASKARRRERG